MEKYWKSTIERDKNILYMIRDKEQRSIAIYGLQKKIEIARHDNLMSEVLKLEAEICRI